MLLKIFMQAGRDLKLCNDFLLHLFLILYFITNSLLVQACKKFYDDGECKDECPSLVIYNPNTYLSERNPAGKEENYNRVVNGFIFFNSTAINTWI